MDGEKKAFALLLMLTIVCLTVLYSLLFLALWQYREWVGASLLTLLIVLVVVFVRGKLVEQDLRQVRFHHHEETPLDETGEPRFWQPGVQVNLHRTSVQQTEEYQSYRYK